MPAYACVVAGKLKLKGKPLDLKSSGVHKKKKKKKHGHSPFSSAAGDDIAPGGNTTALSSHNEDSQNEISRDRNSKTFTQEKDDRLTPAERRYLEQTQKLELQRVAKMATKSHRDRIHEFNRYLANLTEHYDIPKVGPG